jgi:adenylate kinase
MKLIIMGAPASGKGTVSKKIIKDFNLKQISPGVLLREEVAKDTTIGKDIKGIIEKGDLVPNKFVVELVRLEINKHDNFILDGFPRNLEQAQEIEDIKFDAVINLEVPEEVIIERISGRRVCSQCNQEYHIKNIPPKVEGICDKCGGSLIQRKDDTIEVVKNRIATYHKHNQKLLDYYKNILVNIKGDQAPEKVYEDVKQVVTTLKY